MHRLIIVEDTSPESIFAFTDKFSHHIICPMLCVLQTVEKIEVLPEFLLYLCKSIQERNPHECIFIVNNIDITDRAFDKHFNVFRMFVDELKFAQMQDCHGVWLGSPDEIEYALNQVIQWVFG